MAVDKVMGIETEYGIITRGGEDSNPILASSILINSYASPRLKKVRWDYEEENPLRDARGFEKAALEQLEDEGGLVSVILENGARYYVDHAHPEYSTPECSNARDLVIHDKAGEMILRSSMESAVEVLQSGQRILVYKNNSDGKGNSYGCHENYLMSRETPFAAIVKHLMGFFVSRQVFTGAGKVGVESSGDANVLYQISQRSDFFEVEVGLETTFKRPIINTRDEPHADPEKYRRLHVIVGDANMSEVATFLKAGTTAIVLNMIEDGFITAEMTVEQPVAALRVISRDPSCRETFKMADGRSIRAVDLQWEYFDWAKKYLTGKDVDPITAEVVARWEQVLSALENDPMTLDRQLDWVAKLKVLEAYQARHSIGWEDPRVAMVDLQYHDIRSEKGLYNKLVAQGAIETLVSTEEIERAVSKPPEDTRAWFRGTCLSRFASDITAANWDGVVFDVGGETLQKIPMMEPTRGTRALTERLFASVETAAELVEALQA